MTSSHHDPDRPPPRRAVPALLTLGLGLVIAWLLVASNHQPPPRPAAPAPPRPSTLTIPAIGVHAPIVPVGRQANRAMQTPNPGQVGWYHPGPAPGDPGPAVLVGHVDTRTGPDVFSRLVRWTPATRSWSAGPTGPPAGSWSAASSATPRRPCRPAASGPRPPGPCCA